MNSSMLTKILIILLGIALLVAFIFFERRMNAIFKGRSRAFYVGLAAAGVASLAILHFVDFIYIVIGLAIIVAITAILPWLADRWPRR